MNNDNSKQFIELLIKNNLIDSTFQDYLIKESEKGLTKDEKRYLRAILLNSSIDVTKDIKLKNYQEIILRLSAIHFGRDAFLNESMLTYFAENESKDFKNAIIYKNSRGEVEEIFFSNIYRIFYYFLIKEFSYNYYPLIKQIKSILRKETRNIKRYISRDFDDEYSILSEFTLFLFTDAELNTYKYSLLKYIDEFFNRNVNFDSAYVCLMFYDNIFEMLERKKQIIEKLCLSSNELESQRELKKDLFRKIFDAKLYEMNSDNLLAIVSTLFEEESKLLHLDGLLDNIKTSKSFNYIVENFDDFYKIYQKQELERMNYIEEFVVPGDPIPGQKFLTYKIENFLQLKTSLQTALDFSRLSQVVPIEILWKYFLTNTITDEELIIFKKVIDQKGEKVFVDIINSSDTSGESILDLLDIVNHDVLKKIDLEMVKDKEKRDLLRDYLANNEIVKSSKKLKTNKIDKSKQKKDILKQLKSRSFDSQKIASRYSIEILVSIRNKDLGTANLRNNYREVLNRKMNQVKNGKKKKRISNRLKDLKDKNHT